MQAFKFKPVLSRRSLSCPSLSVQARPVIETRSITNIPTVRNLKQSEKIEKNMPRELGESSESSELSGSMESSESLEARELRERQDQDSQKIPTLTGFKLRDYQVNAVQAVLKAFESGIKRPAVVLATGGGKTVVMSHLIPQIPSPNNTRTKTLVLAHKEELVRQTAKTLREMNPHMCVQIDMSKQKPGPEADVIVGSVNTLVRLTRLHKHDPSMYKAIVLDECHHAVANSWLKILNYFGALSSDSEIVVLGFTATLERTDSKALGDVFQKVVYHRGLREMIREKELCDVRFSVIDVDLDLSTLPVRMGDYNIGALSEVINKADINAQVAKAYLQLREKLKFKSTLVFCVDIDHCKTLCGVLQAYGINAQYVTGETAKHVRQDVLEQFKQGKVDVLCNVMVFTEGTDIPNIDSLILARPTKSRPLLTQMIGRGLRLHQGKEFCHVVDMVNTMKIGASSVPTLLGLPSSHDFDKKSFSELDAEKEEADLEKEMQSAKAREESVRNLLKYQQQVKKIELKFKTIDGFHMLVTERKHLSMKKTESVFADFKKRGYHWVRLEYDIWGIPLPFSDSYLVIQRLDTACENFALSRYERTSYERIVASNYKCARSVETPLNTGTLEYLLAISLKLMNWKKAVLTSKAKATVKQAQLISDILSKRVAKMYGPEKVTEFESKVENMTSLRASHLIFATQWSVNSLWVTWELTNLLGLSYQHLKIMDKSKKTIEVAMAKLQISDEKKHQKKPSLLS